MNRNVIIFGAAFALSLVLFTALGSTRPAPDVAALERRISVLETALAADHDALRKLGKFSTINAKIVCVMAADQYPQIAGEVNEYKRVLDQVMAKLD